MHLIFEEDGHFKAGSILSETDATAQVETASGKRSKIKTANILLRFAAPAPGEVMTEAEALTSELDADFLWEAAGTDEFGFEATDAGILRPHPAPGGVGRAAAETARVADLLPQERQGPLPAGARRDAGSGQGRAGEKTPGRRAAGASGRRTRCVPPAAGIRLADSAHPHRAGQEHAGIQGAGRRGGGHRAVAVEADRTLRRHPVDARLPSGDLPAGVLSARHRFRARSASQAIRPNCPRAACAPSRWTTKRPPRSTTRCRSNGATTAASASASTSPRRRSASRPARNSTSWHANGCPPCTTPATRSPCCRRR